MSYKNTANQFGFSSISDLGQPGISIALAVDRYINETEGYKKKEIDDILTLKANIKDTIILKSEKVITNIDMDGKRILNIGSPKTNNDASTKGYVDSQFLKIDGTSQMSGELDMNNKYIINVLNPIANNQAATKEYVDSTFSKAQLELKV